MDIDEDYVVNDSDLVIESTVDEDEDIDEDADIEMADANDGDLTIALANDEKNKRKKKKKKRSETLRETMSEIEPQLKAIIPYEANLDLNECHLWTEAHVSIWLNYLSDWGRLYCKKFEENGVDGRILLEFDTTMIASQCAIKTEHMPQFILAINQLRKVRSCCVGQYGASVSSSS